MAHLFVLLFAPLFLAGLRLMGARRDDRRDNRRHPASAEREPAAPQRLGPYTLDRKIGAGAMSVDGGMVVAPYSKSFSIKARRRQKMRKA